MAAPHPYENCWGSTLKPLQRTLCLKVTRPVDAYVQELVLVLEMQQCVGFGFFFSFFFFFVKDTKRRELLLLFPNKDTTQLQHPVLIRGTNSNSKVHPCTERTDGKPLVQESCEDATLAIVTNPHAAPLQCCPRVCAYSENCVLVLSLKHLHKPEVTRGDTGQ